MRSVLVQYCLAVAALACAFADAHAQDPPASRSANTGVFLHHEIAAAFPQLQRTISVQLEGASIEDALQEVARRAELPITYSDRILPRYRKVWITADEIRTESALVEILRDSGLQLLPLSTGQLVVVRAQAKEEVGTVTGTVRVAGTEQPIVSAQVVVEGTGRGGLTDNAGRYSITGVPAGQQSVTVSSIGYRASTQAVDVADGDTVTVDFALDVAPTALTELVVTATGEQRRLEVGNTVASIKADSLARDAPVMSFGDLIQGRAPGVLSIMTTGGQTGQAGAIRIRGLSSIGVSNAPIVIVDGVRIEATAGTKGGGNNGTSPTAGGFTGRLADLNPDEIASVEVVKGPSAATLYGTDAANGVLVITTKRGQPGRARWTVYSELGVVEQRLDYADQFPDAYYAFGRSTATGAPQRCTLLQRAAGSCVADSLVTFNTFEHPETRPFKDGWREQYGVQVSGGTAGGATYFLSGDYERETGTAYMPPADQAFIRSEQGRVVPDWQKRPNASRRLNLRANLTAPFGRRGSVTLSTGFVSNQARNTNGPLYRQLGYRDLNQGWASGSRPVYNFAQRGEDVVRRFIGSLATTYSVRDWLSVRGTVGADLSTNVFGTLLRRGEGDPDGFATGLRVASELNVARYSLDLGATASHALSSSVSAKTSIGVQYNRRAQRGFNAGLIVDLPVGGETGAGGTLLCCNAEATLTTAVGGAYVEEMLSLRDRLFFTGALRFDGASAFGKDFSVATYPKISLSWVLTDASAGPRLPAVSALRVRAAYGASGVQPGPIDALARLQVASGLDVTGTATAPGAALLTGGNADLKPERSSEVEAGLDLELWQSRVRLELTAYQRTSTDALIARPNPPDIGGSQVENLGSVRNRGLEALLNAELLRGPMLALGFTATGSLNENRLQRLGAGVVARNALREGASTTLLEEGYSIFGLWGFRLESFADANGNGIIEPAEIVLSAESEFLGSYSPTREATAAPYLELFGERLHLSGLLQYRGGFYNSNEPFADACQTGVESCRGVNDPSTPLAEQARAVARASFGRSGPSMEDASYLLWRELSLRLTAPASLARVLGARAGQLVLAGRNLAVLWKASPVPVENRSESGVESFIGGIQPGPSSYWLLRVNLNY